MNNQTEVEQITKCYYLRTEKDHNKSQNKALMYDALVTCVHSPRMNSVLIPTRHLSQKPEYVLSRVE